MSDKCGTLSGYYRHRYWGEKPCDECRAEQSRVRRANKERRRAEFIEVPRVLVASLYLNAPLWLQERVELDIGREKVDSMVELFDKGAR